MLHDEAPIGRIWVHQQAAAWHLVDLAIIEQHRGRGVGRALVCQLQTAARGAGAQITLQVRRDNRARRLYERLGFQVTGQTDLDLEMAWTP